MKAELGGTKIGSRSRSKRQR